MVVRRVWAAAERPISPAGVMTWARSRLFSRFSVAASRARWITTTSRSDLNGFSMKS